MDKVPVVLEKFKPVRFAYQKLNYCSSCGRFTALSRDGCIRCGARHKPIPIDRYFDKTAARHFRRDLIFMSLPFFTGIILARNIIEMVMVFGAGIICFVLLVVLYRLFKKPARITLMKDFFSRNYQRLIMDLKMDINSANWKMERLKYKEAYEDLREIGVLFKDDTARVKKLQCLERFVLRKDMDLELDTLVLSGYNPLLISYISDVVKLNRNLVKKNVIDYVIKYEDRIVGEEWGGQFMGSIADAIIKSKQNVFEYKDFIMRYMKYMKKDRLLRLYDMLHDNHSYNFSSLYGELVRTIDAEYKNDPDFQKIRS